MLLKRLIISFGLALCVGSITGYMFEYKKYFCYDYNSKFSEWPKKWVYKDCYTETYYHTSHALAVGTLTLGLSLLLTGILHKDNK